MKASLYILAALGLTGLGLWVYSRYSSQTANNTTTTGGTSTNPFIRPSGSPIQIGGSKTIDADALNKLSSNNTNSNSVSLTPGYVNFSPTVLKTHLPLQMVMNTPTLANTFIAGLKKTAWPTNVKSNLKSAKIFSDGYYYTIPAGYDYSGSIVKCLLPTMNGSTFYAVVVYDKSWNETLCGNYQTMANGNYVALPQTQWVKY